MFPTVAPYKASINGSEDLFVTKLNPAGSAIIYSTYLGGNSTESPAGIAVDAAGNAYLTGETFSTDFPTTPGAFQTSTQSTRGATFITKVDSSGAALVYSTYLGGSNEDSGAGIALDSSGSAYVVGMASSTDFPTANALQPVFGGNVDAFITKINASGSALVYSTYLGGSNMDFGNGVAVDPVGNAYVTGYTFSIDFPTASALQPSCAVSKSNGFCYNAFVTKLAASGSALVYSTYLGGGTPDAMNSASNIARSIAVDSVGNAYVLGDTSAVDFPTVGAVQSICALDYRGDCADIFVSKLDPTGSALLYSTYLGGSGGENAAFGTGIAVDAAGNAYVAGSTGSTDFPTANPLQAANGGSADVFVATLNASGNTLIFSTYLGGSGYDDTRALALDSSGDIFVTGTTDSGNFPLANAIQSVYLGGGGDAFIAKISGAIQPAIVVFPSSITFPPTLINTTSAPVTVTVSNPGTATLLISEISTRDPFKLQNFSSNIGSGIAPNMSGTFDVVFSPAGTGPYSGTVSITSNAPTSPTTIPLQGTVTMTGTVNVTTNLQTATFTITGPTDFSGSGTSATFDNAPVGDYTIAFGTVSGYITPASQTQTLTPGGVVLFTGTYVPIRPITVDSISGWNAGKAIMNAQWQGQPPGAPDRGKYYLFYAIDSCQQVGQCRGETQSAVVNPIWQINGAGFCSPSGCRHQKGTVTFSDNSINGAPPIAIKAWTATTIKFVPSFVSAVSYQYTANSNVTLTVTAPDGVAVTVSIPHGVIGTIATRGFGQCTWYVANQRIAHQLPIPIPAYQKTSTIDASYVPQQWDVLEFSTKHTAIIISPVTTTPAPQPDGSTIITYDFTIGEMNVAPSPWSEQPSSVASKFVVLVSPAGVRTILKGGKIFSQYSTTKAATAYFR